MHHFVCVCLILDPLLTLLNMTGNFLFTTCASELFKIFFSLESGAQLSLTFHINFCLRFLCVQALQCHAILLWTLAEHLLNNNN